MLPQKLPWYLAQTQWAQQINPVLANILIKGQLLQDQKLINGTVAINHGLGRVPQGWFPVSPQGPTGNVYQAANQPNPTLTLSLTNNAALVTDIWVF